ncbi:MAG: ABC transporter substrate-binding protein, partial [Oscillospiraceae bacterium]
SFGGAGSYLFEYLLTDFNNKVNFGEARPGANASSTYTRSVEIAKEYPAEMKLVPGLGASSYMNAEELADVKTQMDLLNWKDVFVQACFAKTDDEVKNIIEAFRAQLKSAGIEKFETYVKGIYDADPTAVSFYK